MNEGVQEGKVCAVTVAMEELTKDINALDDKVNALAAHLNQVLSPELTINENKGANPSLPQAPVSPLLEHVKDADRHVGLIGHRVQRLMERLEV